MDDGKRDLEKRQPKKPLVVVDWHNTLEVDDDVGGRNAYALTLLLQRTDVVLLSYVQGRKRETKVLEDMKKLPHYTMGKLRSVQGSQGKEFNNCFENAERYIQSRANVFMTKGVRCFARKKERCIS